MNSGGVIELVCELKKVAPELKKYWRKHEVHAACSGMRQLLVDGQPQSFEYTSLTIDEERHLRLVVYARL